MRAGDGREDNGWDVFALQYRVDGPLGTLFPATCAARYRALFTQLWRVKRIEYSLHDAWRDHTILHKRLKHMPGQSVFICLPTLRINYLVFKVYIVYLCLLE